MCHEAISQLAGGAPDDCSTMASSAAVASSAMAGRRLAMLAALLLLLGVARVGALDNGLSRTRAQAPAARWPRCRSTLTDHTY
jgi:hypothetical protein